MEDPWLPPLLPTPVVSNGRPLPGRVSSALFSRGILVCPDSESDHYLASVLVERVPRSVTRIGDVGLFYESPEPDLRRFHTSLFVHHSETPSPGPGAPWDDTWTLAPCDALAVFDHKGNSHGLVTNVAGTYLIRSRILDANDSPGDEFYVAPGWLLEVTMLDPASGEPVNTRWWGSNSH